MSCLNDGSQGPIGSGFQVPLRVYLLLLSLSSFCSVKTSFFSDCWTCQSCWPILGLPSMLYFKNALFWKPSWLVSSPPQAFTWTSPSHLFLLTLKSQPTLTHRIFQFPSPVLFISFYFSLQYLLPSNMTSHVCVCMYVRMHVCMSFPPAARMEFHEDKFSVLFTAVSLMHITTVPHF